MSCSPLLPDPIVPANTVYSFCKLFVHPLCKALCSCVYAAASAGQALTVSEKPFSFSPWEGEAISVPRGADGFESGRILESGPGTGARLMNGWPRGMVEEENLGPLSYVNQSALRINGHKCHGETSLNS